MTQMIATTIEQSKHLVELGIDSKTADMYYLIIAEDEYSEYPQAGDKETILKELPCWSLSALFDLIPPCIEILSLYKDVYDDGIKYRVYYSPVDGTYSPCYSESKTLLEAVYDMVVKLKENNRI